MSIFFAARNRFFGIILAASGSGEIFDDWAVSALVQEGGNRTAKMKKRGCVSLRGENAVELPRRKTNRLCDYDYSQNGAYFITVCTQDRKKRLSNITVGTPVPGCPQEPLMELLYHGRIAEKYIQQMDAFYSHISVDRYVIIPDHIHFLLTFHEADGHPGRGVPTRTSVIARFVGTFKRFCNKEYGMDIWQSRYYDHVIRNQQDYDEIWQYIEDKPRKWIIQNRGYE